jgi:hypothetical protein
MKTMKLNSVPVFVLVALLSAPAIAVEVPKDSFLLWSATGDYQDRDAKALLNQDIKPTVPGVETLGLAQSCAVSAVDVNDKIAFTFKMSFTFRDATGATAEFATAATTPSSVTTAKFPDPRIARFQCGGANQTQYSVDGQGSNLGCVSSGQTPLCQDYPQLFDVGIGIATKGTARFVVIGNAVRGNYQNNVDGTVEFSRFNVSTYNSAGVRVLTKTVLPADASGYQLVWEYASVGDYLNNGANVDEIRLPYYKATATVSTLKYLYYDIQTGALLDTAIVNTTCPGPCRN